MTNSCSNALYMYRSSHQLPSETHPFTIQHIKYQDIALNINFHVSNWHLSYYLNYKQTSHCCTVRHETAIRARQCEQILAKLRIFEIRPANSFGFFCVFISIQRKYLVQWRMERPMTQSGFKCMLSMVKSVLCYQLTSQGLRSQDASIACHVIITWLCLSRLLLDFRVDPAHLSMAATTHDALVQSTSGNLGWRKMSSRNQWLVSLRAGR